MARPGVQSASGLAHAAWLLSRAERGLTAAIERALDGVTIERWRTLVLLGDRGGHPMSEIARFAMLSAASLTRQIDAMVSEGLVYRTTDPGDGRRVLVHIAPRGLSLHRRLQARLEQMEDTLWPAGAHAQEVAETLLEVLARVEAPRRPAG